MRMKTEKQKESVGGAARRRVATVGSCNGDQLKNWPEGLTK